MIWLGPKIGITMDYRSKWLAAINLKGNDDTRTNKPLDFGSRLPVPDRSWIGLDKQN